MSLNLKLTFDLLVFSFAVTTNYAQVIDDSSSVNLKIDPSIKSEAEKYIRPSEFGDGNSDILIYETAFIGDFYLDDSLVQSSTQDNCDTQVFKSNYFWTDDTLEIIGSFENPRIYGFKIIMKDQTALVNHLFLRQFLELPKISNVLDLRELHLEIPCKKAELILSELPDSNEETLIYGKLSFTTAPFEIADNKILVNDNPKITKHQNEMTIYFKSARFVEN